MTESNAAATPDKLLDTKGLTCPLPVLRAKKAMKELSTGQVMKVLATDPGAVGDFAAFCQATGNQMLASTTENNVFVFVIKKTT